MLPHPLTNFEIQRYHQAEPRLDGVKGNNLPAVSSTADVISLDEYTNTRTNQVTCFFKNNNVKYLVSFGVAHFLKVIKQLLVDRNIIANSFIVQKYD